MKQYIDKDVLVAEIERRIKVLNEKLIKHPISSPTLEKLIEENKKVLSIIDTLDVKEVDLDLKKEIKNEIDNLSNLYCYMEDLFNGNEEEGVYPIPEKVKNELFEFAKHFFELGFKAKGKK